MKCKRFSSNFFLVFFGIALGLFITEIFLRIFPIENLWGRARILMGEHLTDCLVGDSKLNHKLMPNCNGVIKTKEYKVAIRTNSLGFRDKEVLAKSESSYRVLILGDSFAEGWGVEVEDRFDTVIKQMAPGKNIETINAGVRSYSPSLEIELAKRNIDIVKPDLVILLLDLSDLHDDYFYGGWERYEEEKKELNLGDFSAVSVWPAPELPLVRFLSYSKLFRLMYSVVGTAILNSQKKIERTNLSWDIGLFIKAQDWDNYDKAWNLTIANIYLLNEFLKEKGIEFAVAVVPRGIFVSADEWSEGRETFGAKRGVLYEPKAYEIISSVIKPGHIDLIDLLGPFKSSRLYPLFYPFDGHWTKEGNKIAGEVMAKYISGKIEEKNRRKN